ncbi:MAG: TPM domain-containing protein [Vulcanimicrobiaceae bacterium]
MNRLTNARIERAIRRAEEGTSGHIVVRIVPDKEVDAFARAREEFERAGLHGASERNVAMVLVAPVAHKYAVLGDRELHARVGDAFWRDLASEMQPYFAKKKLEVGIVYAVDRIGRELKTHFPAKV